MDTPTYDLLRLRDDDPQVANLELSIDIQAATPVPEPELVRARQAEVREQALVTDIKPKTPAPDRNPEPETKDALRSAEIGRKKRPDSSRRRPSKTQEKSLLSRVVGFVFGGGEDEDSETQPKQKTNRRSERPTNRKDRSEATQNQRSRSNRGQNNPETERSLEDSQGGRRRRRRRSKNQLDTDGIETTTQAMEDRQISPEREAELKAHEEDLPPRPKRPQRRQRGKDAIASQEAKLEAHTVTSGEIAIDDAPVLNEGVISETEQPKRARRGRRGSRRENMAPEILEINEKEQILAEAVAASETRGLSQSGASIAVKDSTATQETSSEDRPKGASRGKGRPRKNQTKTDTSESEKIEVITKVGETPMAVSDENPSAENEQPVENVKTPNKKAARSKRVKEESEDTINKVAPDTTAVPSSDKEPKPAAAIVQENEADKPKRIRGRGRRVTPEVPDASPTPSVTDLRAQLVEAGADNKAPKSDAQNRPKQRGRGRPRKSASDENSASEATETK
jgi:ribonuclease E